MIGARHLCFLMTLPLLLIMGCSPQPDQGSGRWYTAEAVTQGQRLYLENCAVCHGQQAEGTAEWKKRNAEGQLPPPPLNGTAHTWHHSKQLLLEIISQGGAPWQGSMPPFQHLLDDQQKLAVIAYIQSHWSDEIYHKWESLDH